MKKISVLFLTLFVLSLIMSCSEPADTATEVPAAVEKPVDVSEDTSKFVGELIVKPKPDEPDTVNPVNKMKLKFAKGTWEYEILNFIESEELKRSFVMDKLPFEGEELPAEASIQLDNLAAIHTTFPFLKIEIQAQTSAANNDLGKKTKQIASKTRAMWVSAKLNMRGVPNNMLSSTGMGDEELIKDIDPTDKGQKRIVAVLTKDRAF